ncbi:uncharacterized protein I303_101397 [Kwoniella dejecticola CBS 10117]|uniref:NADH dehydrogenase (Ubiquinone) 1 alpha subcomplex 5 n=1 Tax=Kwoniella dejecticola CBS 10117 TaxID=1296121 RepID=A0A1A6AHM8_9TREE|nr:NADH dehydrogenase (ubiquinone) 1 alpha subcomplex 5 [Kwoniella dejecticola CBS 10117]OBR89577.1 NADH dehydrogenase (ubiquinone) 1 alpha subcomplex 5 [Kwoniella dejecticola CBS 10117]
MLRASRVLLSALRPIKATTGITGLEVHPDPLPALKSIYSSTLTTLNSLPPTSVYRQATEALTKHRLSVVEQASQDVTKVETELGKIIEETLEEAKTEQGLAAKMIEWKSWENLEQEPHPDQWRYFEPASDV